MSKKLSPYEKLNKKVEETSEACNYQFVTKDKTGAFGSKPWNYVKGLRLVQNINNPENFTLFKLHKRDKFDKIAVGSMGVISRKLNVLKEGCEFKWDSFDRYCDWVGGEVVEMFDYPEVEKKCHFLDLKDKPSPKERWDIGSSVKQDYTYTAGDILRVDVVTDRHTRPSAFYALKYIPQGGNDGSLRMIEIDESTFRAWYNEVDARIDEIYNEDPKEGEDSDTGEFKAIRNKIDIDNSYYWEKMEGTKEVVTTFSPGYGLFHSKGTALKRPEEVQKIFDNLKPFIEENKENETFIDAMKLLRNAYPSGSQYHSFDDKYFRKLYLEPSPFKEGLELDKTVRSVGSNISNIKYAEKEYKAREKFPEAKIWKDIDKVTPLIQEAKDLLASDEHQTKRMRELNTAIRDQENAFDVFVETLDKEFEEY